MEYIIVNISRRWHADENFLFWWLFAAVVVWSVSSAITAGIALKKGYNPSILPLLGPFGVLIAVLLPRRSRDH